MRRTKEEAEKTRYAILEAAEQLFLKKGVTHTSLEQIARHAGVTRGAVYWHFQNKAHLVIDMINQITLPIEQLIALLHEKDQEEDTLRMLYNLSVRIFQSMDVDNQKHFNILTIYIRRCEFTQELDTVERRGNDIMNEYLRIAEKLLSQKNNIKRLMPGITPALAARALHVVIHGICADWISQPDQINPQQDAPVLLNAAFRGLIRDWPDQPPITS